MYKKLVDIVTSKERYSGIIFNLSRIGIRPNDTSNIINDEIYINHLFLSVFYKLVGISKLMNLIPIML